jgi:HD superfamily phosphohydrolase
MVRKLVTLDPIHGRIEIPPWLAEIEKFQCVRRMMFIRQLGLKAYIDFPGAIHTRYSHALGAMYLAGKVSEQLADKISKKGPEGIQVAKNLRDNKNDLMAGGFLHDIGHGPFSHAVDYSMKIIAGKTHEQLAGEVIDHELQVLENHGITSSSVKKIIIGAHDYPFISQIVNGQLDVDKLDYLLRDAHHIGLRYSFDIDHFVNSYAVLGVGGPLGKCSLGLDYSTEATVTAEIFILIWKSMYDLVYHVLDSRIAEKMLEKAVLIAARDNKNFKNNFLKLSRFMKLYDDSLLGLLERSGNFAKGIINQVRDNKLYSVKADFLLKGLPTSKKFLAALEDENQLADEITIKLCNELHLERYELICDIIKSRVPKSIDLDRYDRDGDPIELAPNSDVIRNIKQKIIFRVYGASAVAKKHADEKIKSRSKQIIGSW